MLLELAHQSRDYRGRDPHLFGNVFPQLSSDQHFMSYMVLVIRGQFLPSSTFPSRARSSVLDEVAEEHVLLLGLALEVATVHSLTKHSDIIDGYLLP